MQQVVDNQIRMDPKAQERLAQATPEQREMGNKIAVGITEGVFIGGPDCGHSGRGPGLARAVGHHQFWVRRQGEVWEIFAVFYYAWLPAFIKALLGTIVIYAGMAPESFNIKNFAPTNLGAFLDPVETNKALYTLATSLDVRHHLDAGAAGHGHRDCGRDEAQFRLHCGVWLVGALCADRRGLGGDDGLIWGELVCALPP